MLVALAYAAPPPVVASGAVVIGVLGSDPLLTRAVLRRDPAGLVLFAHHLSDGGASVRRRLTAAGRRVRPILMVDQEGGVVRRLPALGPPSAPELGAGSTSATRRSFRQTGRALHRLGIAVDLAPVADVAQSWSFMQSRSYGTDPARVGRHVGAALRGLAAGGTTGCLKHFPGLGSVRVNTDHGRGVDVRSQRAVQRDLAAFRAGIRAGARCVMVSNAVTPSLCPRPAVLCRSTYLRLRAMGFRGAIITDSLNAGALRRHGPPDILAVRALRLGADGVMVTGPGATLDTMLRIEDSVRRGALWSIDLAASAARLQALRHP